MTGIEPALCILCPPHRAKQTRDGGVTCWRCHDRLGEMIREIVDRYLKLDPSPGGAGATDRRAPGFRSTPPLNLHVVALRDPRTKPIYAGDPYCALVTLRAWSNRVSQSRQQGRREGGAIVSTADYLLANLDWITRFTWVFGLHAELDVVRAQLRSATGEPNPKPVGWCVAPIHEDLCGHPLFPPRHGEGLMVCGGCAAEYDHLSQIRLRLAGEVDPGPPASPCACGHADPQHDPDNAGRPCNVRWCSCKAYSPVKVAA